jgi:hypothetical protein
MKALLLVFLCACHGSSPSGSSDLSAPPNGTVRLTVSAAATITGIDHLAVTVEAAGAKSTIQLFSPAAIPPGVTFDLPRPSTPPARSSAPGAATRRRPPISRSI